MLRARAHSAACALPPPGLRAQPPHDASREEGRGPWATFARADRHPRRLRGRVGPHARCRPQRGTRCFGRCEPSRQCRQCRQCRCHDCWCRLAGRRGGGGVGGVALDARTRRGPSGAPADGARLAAGVTALPGRRRQGAGGGTGECAACARACARECGWVDSDVCLSVLRGLSVALFSLCTPSHWCSLCSPLAPLRLLRAPPPRASSVPMLCIAFPTPPHALQRSSDPFALCSPRFSRASTARLRRARRSPLCKTSGAPPNRASRSVQRPARPPARLRARMVARATLCGLRRLRPPTQPSCSCAGGPSLAHIALALPRSPPPPMYPVPCTLPS